jgi:hypothetical protein
MASRRSAVPGPGKKRRDGAEDTAAARDIDEALRSLVRVLARDAARELYARRSTNAEDAESNS